jgi:hypothetical protein
VPTIVRKLPFEHERPAELAVPGGLVVILPFQIVLSVSITPKHSPLDPQAPRFPAIFDSGFNQTCLLQEQHLNRWAGLRREHLEEVDTMRAYARVVPVLAANLWIHPNRPGTREPAPDRPAFCIHLDPGIGVCPRDLAQPRLPLLGLRALFLADLQICFHWRARCVSLYTTPWWAALLHR